MRASARPEPAPGHPAVPPAHDPPAHDPPAHDPPPLGSPPSTPAPPAEVLVAACDLRRSGYSVHRERGAPNWLFTWTLGGAGWFRQGGVEVLAGPGDLVVAGPDVAHDYAVAEERDDWLFWWVHCQVRTNWHQRLRPYEVGKRLYAVSGVPTGLHARIESAFRRLHADVRWSGGELPPEPVVGGTARPAVAWGATARALALNAVEEVVLLATGGRLSEREAGLTGERGASLGPVAGEAASGGGAGVAGGRSGARIAVDDRVRRAESILLADPAARHTVASLAAAVALSPSRLAHLFVEQTGRTPMQALRNIRLQHAARLLEATDLTVESVSAASGFASPFHFSRVFRTHFGLPPAAYRSACRDRR